MESGFVFFIEGFAALVEDQVLNLFVRYARLLRRSNVSTRSILTAVKR
jgi:hypothetical protein